MEEKRKMPGLHEDKKGNFIAKLQKEIEVKDKSEIEIILRESMQKLSQKEREQLLKIINSKNLKKNELDESKHNIIKHSKLPILELQKDMQETELKIELAANKMELIKLLNDINALLFECNK